MAYKTPVLDEIYVETFYEAGSIRAESFFSIVPKLMEADFSEVEFSEAGIRLAIDPDAEDSVVPQPKPRVRCWLPDRSAVAQVSEDMVAVNLVGDYPGWARFTELFGEVLKSTQAGTPEAQPRSMNLSTIDRFTLPREGFRLGNYIQCGGTFIPAWYADADGNMDVNLGRGFLAKDGFNRKIGLRVRIEGDEVAVQLRASFHDRLQTVEPSGLLEALHEESTKTFESIITDRVREEIMGGLV